jgi:hypothetical protein
MFTVILSVESVNFFTFSLIYLCKSESQKVLAQLTDVLLILIVSPLTYLGSDNARCKGPANHHPTSNSPCRSFSISHLSEQPFEQRRDWSFMADDH